MAYSYEAERRRQERQRYIESQVNRAAQMTKDLEREYSKYNSFSDGVLKMDTIDVFEWKRKQFEPKDFVYSEVQPELTRYRANYVSVPNKSWLEIFSAARKEKRLKAIEQNEKLRKEMEDSYHKDLDKYLAAKEAAIKQWKKIENERKAAFEENIKKQEELYKNHDGNAIKDYINSLISISQYSKVPIGKKRTDIISGYDLGYQPITKKLIMTIHVEGKEYLLEVGGYKYMRQTDSFEKTKMPVSSANKLMRDLMIELAIATAALFYKNDKADALQTIIINIYHDRIACVSMQTDKAIFMNTDFDNKTQKAEFQENQMRISKSLSSKITPYERLSFMQ